MADDYCTKKVKSQYAVWPSARASQAVAKCRKERGDVRKGEEGTSLRRWEREEWKDKATGEAVRSGRGCRILPPLESRQQVQDPEHPSFCRR